MFERLRSFPISKLKELTMLTGGMFVLVLVGLFVSGNTLLRRDANLATVICGSGACTATSPRSSISAAAGLVNYASPATLTWSSTAGAVQDILTTDFSCFGSGAGICATTSSGVGVQQSIYSNGGSEFKFFTDSGGTQYALMANGGNDDSSMMYKWMSGSNCLGDGTTCATISTNQGSGVLQNIHTSNTASADAITIGTDTYAAFSNTVGGGGNDIVSVYKLMPASTDTGTVGGLTGKYYNNTRFTGTAGITRQENVNFNWGSGSPGAGIPADNFGGRWTGELVAPASGTYTFRLGSDDGSMMYINDSLFISNWGSHGYLTVANSITLTAGQKIKVVIEFEELTGGAQVDLKWNYPGFGFSYVAVPTTVLYSDYAHPECLGNGTVCAEMDVDSGRFQTIYSSTPRGIKFFTVGTDTFLAVANNSDIIRIYKWSGTCFGDNAGTCANSSSASTGVYQSIFADTPEKLATFVIGTDTFLAVVDRNGVRISKWMTSAPSNKEESTLPLNTTLASAGYTFFDRAWSVDNNKTVISVGAYSTVAQTVTVKIGKRNSAGNFDIVTSQACTIPANMWVDCALSTPYAVPASGSYYAGVYMPTAGGGASSATGPVAYKSGNITGNGQTGFTENSTTYPTAVRVMYSGGGTSSITPCFGDGIDCADSGGIGGQPPGVLQSIYASGGKGVNTFNANGNAYLVIAGHTSDIYVHQWMAGNNTVPVNTAVAGAGLSGTYFGNMTLTGSPTLTTQEAVNFDWGGGSPGGSTPSDGFSTRWLGTLVAPVSGSYTFYTNTDDGVRLWVNNSLVIDHWVDEAPTEYSYTVTLNANQQVPIRMEYYENSFGAVAQLKWSYPGQAKVAIPAASLYPASGCFGNGTTCATLTAGVGAVQSFYANNAEAADPFAIGTDEYLAVANSSGGSTDGSRIYKWLSSANGGLGCFGDSSATCATAAAGVGIFQSIYSNSGQKWTPFVVGGIPYIAMANGNGGSTDGLRIYQAVSNSPVLGLMVAPSITGNNTNVTWSAKNVNASNACTISGTGLSVGPLGGPNIASTTQLTTVAPVDGAVYTMTCHTAYGDKVVTATAKVGSSFWSVNGITLYGSNYPMRTTDCATDGQNYQNCFVKNFVGSYGATGLFGAHAPTLGVGTIVGQFGGHGPRASGGGGFEYTYTWSGPQFPNPTNVTLQPWSTPVVVNTGTQVKLEWTCQQTQPQHIQNGCSYFCGDYHDAYTARYANSTVSTPGNFTGGALYGSALVTVNADTTYTVQCVPPSSPSPAITYPVMSINVYVTGSPNIPVPPTPPVTNIIPGCSVQAHDPVNGTTTIATGDTSPAGGFVTDNLLMSTSFGLICNMKDGSTEKSFIYVKVPPIVSVSPVTNAAEPSTNGAFSVSLNETSDTDLVVNYAISGTATPGTDYTTLPGTVTIPAGQTSATINVVPIDDLLFEGDESVVLTIGSSANYTVSGTNGATTTMIVDDETAASLPVSTATMTSCSGTAGASCDLGINPSRAKKGSNVTVTWQITGMIVGANGNNGDTCTLTRTPTATGTNLPVSSTVGASSWTNTTGVVERIDSNTLFKLTCLAPDGTTSSSVSKTVTIIPSYQEI